MIHPENISFLISITPLQKQQMEKNSINSIYASSTCPKLFVNYQDGHILYNLTTVSLISIGKHGDNYIYVFIKYHIKIVKYGNLIIVGSRNLTNDLWNIPIVSKNQLFPHQNNISLTVLYPSKIIKQTLKIFYMA